MIIRISYVDTNFTTHNKRFTKSDTKFDGMWRGHDFINTFFSNIILKNMTNFKKKMGAFEVIKVCVKGKVN